MRKFQSIIATSKFTLPVVSVIAAILWLLTTDFSVLNINVPTDNAQDDALWLLAIPQTLQQDFIGKLTGMLSAALSIYLMAEFNNTNILLRISSRMLSSLLALLLGISTFFHCFQPGHIVMPLIMLTYFELFATYQSPNTLHTYLCGLSISIASLAFPKALLFTPFLWTALLHLRSLTLRTFCASVLGILTPYWFFAGFAFITDNLPLFLSHAESIIHFEIPDYSGLSLRQALTAGLTLILFCTGAIDFKLHSYQDKTRTRILYDIIIFFGIVSFIFLALQAQLFNKIYPFVLINTAIVAGHNIALTQNKFMNIYTIIVMIASAAIIVI